MYHHPFSSVAFCFSQKNCPRVCVWPKRGRPSRLRCSSASECCYCGPASCTSLPCGRPSSPRRSPCWPNWSTNCVASRRSSGDPSTGPPTARVAVDPTNSCPQKFPSGANSAKIFLKYFINAVNGSLNAPLHY